MLLSPPAPAMPMNATTMAQSSGGSPPVLASIAHETDIFDPFVCEQVAEAIGEGLGNLGKRRVITRAARIAQRKTRRLPEVMVRRSRLRRRASCRLPRSRRKILGESASSRTAVEQTIADLFQLGSQARRCFAGRTESTLAPVVTKKSPVGLPSFSQVPRARYTVSPRSLEGEVALEDDRLGTQRHGAETEKAGADSRITGQETRVTAISER